MKEIFGKSIILIFDLIGIIISICIAYIIRGLTDDLFVLEHNLSLLSYLKLYPIYLLVSIVFLYEGIYTYRYDFWHESKLVIKGLILSLMLLLSYLALTKSMDDYSRAVIILSFALMCFFIPLIKNLLKKKLFKMGLWQRKVKLYNEDEYVKTEIFDNHYLGYIESSNKEAQTVFINSHNSSPKKLQEVIDKEIHKRDRVLFIPIFDNYELTTSDIYELSNTRTNLIVFQNRLKSKYRMFIHTISNYILALLILPILLPVIGIIAILIKRESPGPVFFTHNRIGKNGKIIPTIKFRSMYQDAKERLDVLLEDNPEIKEEWNKNFKLKDDPRVTKIGKILRRTSLDELPQIFNVLKGEMNFVGPRPVVQEEIDSYYKEDAEYYFMVKPGITGLWQVSGRSDTDYDFRVSTDKWYVMNWSLWLDIVILIKTIKVVIKKEGAY